MDDSDKYKIPTNYRTRCMKLIKAINTGTWSQCTRMSMTGYLFCSYCCENELNEYDVAEAIDYNLDGFNINENDIKHGLPKSRPPKSLKHVYLKRVCPDKFLLFLTCGCESCEINIIRCIENTHREYMYDDYIFYTGDN